MTGKEMLQYCHFGSFEFWFSWFFILFVGIAILFSLFVIFMLIYISIIEPLFRRFCIKHGYEKKHFEHTVNIPMTYKEYNEYSKFKRTNSEVV